MVKFSSFTVKQDDVLYSRIYHVMTKEVLANCCNYSILTVHLHKAGAGRTCTVVGDHFHYILEFSQDFHDKVQRGKRVKNTFAGGNTIQFTEQGHLLAMENYFSKINPESGECEYIRLELDDDLKVVDVINKYVSTLKDTKPKKRYNARSEEEIISEGQQKLQDLSTKYKNGKMDRLKQFGHLPEMRKLINKEYEEYKTYVRAQKQLDKFVDLTSSDYEQLLEWGRQKKTIELIAKQLAIKIRNENKIPCLLLSGEASSGKSLYAKVFGEAIGNTVQLKAKCIATDVLMGEMIKRADANNIIFEELCIDGLNLKQRSEIYATLKDLTSGSEKSLRTALNVKGDETNYMYKLDALIITTNAEKAAISEFYTGDKGLNARIVHIHFPTEIPLYERWTQEECVDNETLLIKYAMHLLKTESEMQDCCLESDETIEIVPVMPIV